MPKPSAANMMPDAAVESTGSLAGKFEVVGSVYKVHKDKEYELKPGQIARANPKVMAYALKVSPCGDDGERLEDADLRDLILKMGATSLNTFHPGKGSSADDTDPEDLGDELNTEGNTLYTSGGDISMNAKSGYTVFMKSLQHRGFPKEKIAECWAPNLKGLKFELATVTPDKLEQYGQKKGETNKDGENITYKVVQSIIGLPGTKAGKKAKTEEPAAAPAAKKSTPAPAPAPAAAKAEVEDDDDNTADSGGGNEAEAEAIRVLKIAAAKLAGKNKKIDQAKTYWLTLYSDPKVKGSTKLQKAAREFINNDGWLTGQLDDLGCIVDAEERTVQFAEAA